MRRKVRWRKYGNFEHDYLVDSDLHAAGITITLRREFMGDRWLVRVQQGDRVVYVVSSDGKYGVDKFFKGVYCFSLTTAKKAGHSVANMALLQKWGFLHAQPELDEPN